MNPGGVRKLKNLRESYAKVRGYPFEYFYCPILYRDEDVELCRAHVINEGFEGSSRHWTIQRKDVDGFYGSAFEADFTTLQDKGKYTPAEVLADPELSRRLKPLITADGEAVDYYRSKGQVPDKHVGMSLIRDERPVELVLKMTPDDVLSRIDANWQIGVERDLRLPALVSVLKAAHLTMFELGGYEYALSGGGHFLEHDVLGSFFLANSGKSKAEISAQALEHFLPFVNMARPVLSAPDYLTGTIADRYLHFCMGPQGPWAMLVYVRTGSFRHAVLVPNFDKVENAVRFHDFLESPMTTLDIHLARFEGDHWAYSPESHRFEWPAPKFHDPVGPPP